MTDLPRGGTGCKQREPTNDPGQQGGSRMANERKAQRRMGAVLAALAAAAVTAPAAGGATRAGPIVYVGFTGHSADIFVMNPDGSYATNLTSSRAFDTAPEVSPDGTAIAFERSGRDAEIFVMGSDGGGLTRLTDNDVFDGSPAFSPDGTRIAFLRAVGTGGLDLFVMDADGSDVQRLTTVGDLDPGGISWSPGGTSIAVARFDANFDTDLWSVDAATGSASRLMAAPNSAQYSPRYSPDGSYVAYLHSGHGRSSLRRIPAEGGTPATVVGGSDLHVDSFAFAPDGSSVLVSVLVGDGIPELRSYALDGSSYALVAREAAGELAWSACSQADCTLTEPSATAVSVSAPLRTGKRKVTVFSSTAPMHVGAVLTFTYYKRRADGTWRVVATKDATVEPSGFATASFVRFERGRCRTSVSFPGDHDHLPGHGRGSGPCRGVVAG